jgi:hypothetical protein
VHSILGAPLILAPGHLLDRYAVSRYPRRLDCGILSRPPGVFIGAEDRTCRGTADKPVWVVSGGNVDGRDAVVELQGSIYGVFRKK